MVSINCKKLTTMQTEHIKSKPRRKGERVEGWGVARDET